ncbi:MAG: trigger factor [Gammaproteobacteria bacterium]
MDVSVEAIGELERRLIIKLPADEIDSKVEQKLKEAAKTVRVNGFRPGKVPVREVRRRFGESVRFEIISEAIDASYSKALNDQSFLVASQPQIEILNNQAGSAFQYQATVEVFPEVTLNNLDCIEVKNPIVSIEESDVDELIEQVREQYATWEQTSEAAADGHIVLIDFNGTIDGEPFEGGAETDYEVVIGSGKLAPGFEDQLVGVRTDDAITVTVTFPEDYSQENLQGKTAQFAVNVKAVKQKQFPELDDAFFEKLGMKADGGIEQFRQNVRENMSNQLKQAVEDEIRSQVFNELLKLNPLSVPKALVEKEMARQRDEALQRAVQQFEVDEQQISKLFPLDFFRERSERSVKIALMLSEYIKLNDIQADDELIDAKIREMAVGHINADNLIQFYRKNEQHLEQVKATVVESMVVEKLLAGAKVTENPVSYFEAIRGDFGRPTEDEDEDEGKEHDAAPEAAAIMDPTDSTDNIESERDESNV